MTDAELVAAARFEVDQRERHYPGMVASKKLTADEATVDFQAWHCILGFLESGQFYSIDAGGVDGRTIVDWALAEAAANRAVTVTRDALAKAVGEEDEAKAQRLEARLEGLRLIARKVSRQHALIASINAEFRARRQSQAQAAA